MVVPRKGGIDRVMELSVRTQPNRQSFELENQPLRDNAATISNGHHFYCDAPFCIMQAVRMTEWTFPVGPGVGRVEV